MKYEILGVVLPSYALYFKSLPYIIGPMMSGHFPLLRRNQLNLPLKGQVFLENGFCFVVENVK